MTASPTAFGKHIPPPQRLLAALDSIHRLSCSTIAILCVGIVLSSCSSRSPPTGSSILPAAPVSENIDWKDLIPPEEAGNSRMVFAFAMSHLNHDSEEAPRQFGSFKTVAALEGRTVSLVGYVVPLDTNEKGDMTSFLFVPTLGACIHVPPPPPDQIVYVTLERPIHTPEEGEPRLLRGVLHTQTYDLQVASAAYAMQESTSVSVTLTDAVGS